MTPRHERTSNLTKRMAEDMLLRNMAQSAIDAYANHVGRFAEFLGRSPEDASRKTCDPFNKGTALDLVAWRVESVAARRLRRPAPVSRCEFW